MTTSPARPWTRVYVAVGLTAMATLLLELALTRIFSVVLFYHFAFLAISIALFGLGAGGILSYWFPGRPPSALWPRLGLLSTCNLIVTAGALTLLLNLQVSSLWRLPVIYFALTIPFLLVGIILSQAMAVAGERVHRVYASDLLGAGIGCLLLIPLLDLSGGANTVLAAAGLYGAAGAVWYMAASRRASAWGALVLTASIALFIVWNTHSVWLDLRFAKGGSLGPELFVRWNSFSRVAVRPDDGAGNPNIVIDADASTSIASFSPDTADSRARDALLRTGSGLTYRLRPGGKTLIIGPGGGFDVARALASGSREITGVEINPIIIDDIMRGRFAAQSRNLYFRPEVRIYVDDGRSFVKRSREHFQVIQMTLVDTWASTVAGAFALSENNLYTTEAFIDYLSHLTPDGVLAVTRWGFDPPRESLRIVSLGVQALQRVGARAAREHFLVVRGQAQNVNGFGALDTVLLKRTPWNPEEIDSAQRAIAEAALVPIYIPGKPLPNPFNDLLLAPDPYDFALRYQFDITPVGDNRPFFFYTVRPRDLVSFFAGRENADVKINIGVLLLYVLLAVSLFATALILLLPPLLHKNQLPQEPAVLVRLAYFFTIGVGFIMVEVGLIQRFVLLLGRPTYSLTVVVFSLLVSSGLGSFVSAKWIAGRDRRLAVVLLGVAAIVALLSLAVPPVVSAAIGLSLPVRCAVAAALLFPAGFMMGMPFPSGLRSLERIYPGAVPWAWAINSASSVLGSVTAVFVSIHLGLTQTLLLGGSAYLIALLSLRMAPSPSPATATVSLAPAGALPPVL